MGRLWRVYKSELTGSVTTVLESRRNRTETARLLGLIRPEDVPQAEWDQFVAERSTGECKVKSEKMKAVRAKQLLPHTLSQKGYAREEYEHAEMEAKLAEQPSTEGPIPVKHDVLSQVLGKEKNGRVREIGGEYVSVKSAGNLSTLFDAGGIVGGILAGYISDKLNARATTAACFMYVAIPAMLLYRRYGSISHNINILLMMVAGLFINGPYALITTAVSADLGTHSSLRGDSRALATVTAIIDGTGSVGAAFGPLLTGFLQHLLCTLSSNDEEKYRYRLSKKK
ncbi:hypothetical protein ACLB2K_046532 [Fragaria x ananassa]